MRRFTVGWIQGVAIIAVHTACAGAGPETVAMAGPVPAIQSETETESAADSPADAPGLPRVTIVATGGTIAGVSETRTSFQSYEAGEVGIDEMLAELRPEIDEVADVTAVQFGNRPSGGYAIADFYDLTLAVEKALETADAVVVTSGTGSMDEFVYWLDLTVQSQKPVVITGAMRPWTVIGSDAQANLFNAIVLASSGETRCFGTVLMLNDEFHAAKEAWKGDAYRMDTFVSRELGILGYIDELDVQTYRAPPRAQHCADPGRWMTPFDLSGISKDDLPRTEVLIGYQDAGLDEAITAWAEAGVRGIVLAGGRGSEEVQEEAEEMGVIFRRTHRFRTGGDNLYPQKARLLLLLSLAFTDDPEQVDAWFEELGAAEFEIDPGR
jgi:L-asparaginase